MFKFLDFKNRINESRGDIPALEAALAEARKIHADTLRELQQIAARRTDYLLGDRDDDLDRDDKRASVLHRILEKAKASIPEVERRLVEARSAARSRLVAEWQAKANASFEQLRDALGPAIAAWQKDRVLRAELERMHLSEVAIHDPFMRGYDLAAIYPYWLSDSEDRLGFPKLAPVKAAPKSHGTNGAVKQAAPRRRPLQPAAEYRPTPGPPKPPRIPVAEEPQDGFTRVVVIRGGFEHAGRQLHPGDIVNLLPEEAEQALRGAAIDLAPVRGQEARP